MTATILDGKAIAAAIRDDLRSRVRTLAERGVVPGLGMILLSDDPASHTYVAGKHRDRAEIGTAPIQREAVVNVGSTRVVGADGKARVVGDVDPAVREVAGHLAPMPGGAGPMTRAVLLTNVVEAAERST